MIGLNKDHFCPFLNEQKLCKLVIEHGDEILSETCASFPRQTHEFADRVEKSLVVCCPTVIDLLHQQERFTVSEDDKKEHKESGLVLLRQNCMDLIQNASYTISDELWMIFFMLLDVKEKDFTLSKTDINARFEWKNIEEMKQAFDAMERSVLESMEEQNGLFLDLCENYRKEGMYQSYLNEIITAAEEMEHGYDEDKMKKYKLKFNEDKKKWDSLFRKWIALEIFTNTILPGSNLDDFIIAMQWIGMEYAILQQVLFLKWQEKEKLTYEEIRELLAIIARMSGYEQEDMVEYLENSFENLFWEWGYFALITE